MIPPALVRDHLADAPVGGVVLIVEGDGCDRRQRLRRRGRPVGADQDGVALDILVQARRDANAAKRFSKRLLDASVLYPVSLRNLLTRLTFGGLFQARWWAHVHEEWNQSRHA
jgi:hypothetical protein